MNLTIFWGWQVFLSLMKALWVGSASLNDVVILKPDYLKQSSSPLPKSEMPLEMDQNISKLVLSTWICFNPPNSLWSKPVKILRLIFQTFKHEMNFQGSFE